MRQRIVAGNWKMNTRRQSARDLAAAVVRGTAGDAAVEVVVCPPFPYLPAVAEALAGSHVALGAQNCHDRSDGAFTGEVSAAMLADVGCRYVILGHSERRHGLGESDGFIRGKLQSALAAGLRIILCVGETLAERQAGQLQAVLSRQVQSALEGLNQQQLAQVVLAYEPVWAIGTGQTATPEQAQEAHAFLRDQVRRCGDGPAAALPILYGGSVTATNAAELFRQPDIDGGLIGGASLKPDQFQTIVASARP